MITKPRQEMTLAEWNAAVRQMTQQCVRDLADQYPTMDQIIEVVEENHRKCRLSLLPSQRDDIARSVEGQLFNERIDALARADADSRKPVDPLAETKMDWRQRLGTGRPKLEPGYEVQVEALYKATRL
jgi:hypothetical protein